MLIFHFESSSSPGARLLWLGSISLIMIYRRYASMKISISYTPKVQNDLNVNALLAEVLKLNIVSKPEAGALSKLYFVFIFNQIQYYKTIYN